MSDGDGQSLAVLLLVLLLFLLLLLSVLLSGVQLLWREVLVVASGLLFYLWELFVGVFLHR